MGQVQSASTYTWRIKHMAIQFHLAFADNIKPMEQRTVLIMVAKLKTCLSRHIIPMTQKRLTSYQQSWKEGADVIKKRGRLGADDSICPIKTKSLFFLLSVFSYIFKESTKLALTMSLLGLIKKINVNTALAIIFCCFYCSIYCGTGCNTSAIEEAQVANTISSIQGIKEQEES